ncbi:UDP-N-acetylglucosamine 2-epimerase [Campylobacter iguaniorum]|uniref:UDP-N-acetylglucosamine 2-epimerase n=1 Tax=Campylobacter iguaniorum TaxID=1244531 RepID=UPI0007C913BA|nr:UDP-N-acetylglucosamine 2-epimerase [Campylobacter iguaniorum]ANE35939.1 UDP-N-acetylglucosamine 2-epimerase [Campylobacter iguaniorum]
MSKEILFITGTRADFGKIKSLIKVVDDLPNCNYQIYITGMHLLKKYGNTYLEILKSGFKNYHKFINQHLNESMDLILANTIQGLSRYVSENRPDMIIVHGDRIEALAGAIVGSLNNILVAHIEGGERSGTIDDMIRHSVTKLSHIHLVCNNESYNRVLQMGEQKNTIFIIGSPDIDVMISNELPDISYVKNYYGIKFQDYHIVMFHPVTTEYDSFSVYVNNFVQALYESNENFIIIYPNNDMGSNLIFDAYERLKNKKNILFYPSINFEKFLVLLKNAKSIIGNSSAGIREAPFYGVPTINIGTRQKNRIIEAESIINIDYSVDEIKYAINKVLDNKTSFTPISCFGIGNSSTLFREILLDQTIWNISPQKNFYDINSVGRNKL